MNTRLVFFNLENVEIVKESFPHIARLMWFQKFTTFEGRRNNVKETEAKVFRFLGTLT